MFIFVYFLVRHLWNCCWLPLMGFQEIRRTHTAAQRVSDPSSRSKRLRTARPLALGHIFSTAVLEWRRRLLLCCDLLFFFCCFVCHSFSQAAAGNIIPAGSFYFFVSPLFRPSSLIIKLFSATFFPSNIQKIGGIFIMEKVWTRPLTTNSSTNYDN